MCKWSDQLIAWLDCELTTDAAATLERHLDGCATCRRQLDTYRRTSAAIVTYGEWALTATNHRIVGRQALIVCAAAAAVVAVVGVFALSPKYGRVETPPESLESSSASLSPLETSKPVPPSDGPQFRELRVPERQTAMKAVRSGARRRSVSLAAPAGDESGWSPPTPAIRIAIPFNEIFPPGAVPDGVSFNADLTIAPDGSAQWLRLWP
jgi:hypothetical protein